MGTCTWKLDCRILHINIHFIYVHIILLLPGFARAVLVVKVVVGTVGGGFGRKGPAEAGAEPIGAVQDAAQRGWGGWSIGFGFGGGSDGGGGLLVGSGSGAAAPAAA